MAAEPPELELINDTAGRNSAQSNTYKVSVGRGRTVSALLAGAMLVGLVWFALSDDGSDLPLVEPDRTADSSPPQEVDETLDATVSEPVSVAQVVRSLPPSLLAAEVFAGYPSRDTLHHLFNEIGGFNELELGIAEGAFDIVRFDPADPNRLLASNRLSYGDAENQAINEVWQLTPSGEIQQALWNPQTSHDFAHFNVDGTITMWSHGGGDGFAPRKATVLDGNLEPIFTTTPIYASRFTATAEAVFALTGNGDYYTNQPGYVNLIADSGDGPEVLDNGALYEWIDNPTADILVAYPVDESGVTAVWEVSTLQPIPSHPLAGHHFQRIAISGDGQVAVAATTEGPLAVIDPATGELIGTFGEVDVTGIDNPITLNHDGTVAITVERTGRVRIWWVGEDEPIHTLLADATQPRWVAQEYAPRSATAVSASAGRAAIRIGARADRATHWALLDTDVSSWIARACALAGQALEADEARTLGFTAPFAC